MSVCVTSNKFHCIHKCDYLHSQRERVAENQHKHDIFKLAGVDNLPEFELGRIFGDVNLDGLSFQRVIHTLALQKERATRGFICLPTQYFK